MIQVLTWHECYLLGDSTAGSHPHELGELSEPRASSPLSIIHASHILLSFTPTHPFRGPSNLPDDHDAGPLDVRRASDATIFYYTCRDPTQDTAVLLLLSKGRHMMDSVVRVRDAKLCLEL